MTLNQVLKDSHCIYIYIIPRRIAATAWVGFLLKSEFDLSYFNLGYLGYTLIY